MGIVKQHYFIRFNKEIRADLSMWLHFLDNFNGKPVLLKEDWESSDVTQLFTDASGSVGFAAVFGSKWFAEEWSEYLSPMQIAIKELFPIVLALEIWGSEMANKKILFMSDNMAVVEVINKQTSREKNLMHLLRRLVLVCLSKNILFRAKHIPGKYNIIADRLSRLQFQLQLWGCQRGPIQWQHSRISILR